MADHTQRIRWDYIVYTRGIPGIDNRILHNGLVSKSIDGKDVVIDPVTYKATHTVCDASPECTTRDLAPRERLLVDQYMRDNILDSTQIDWDSMRRHKKSNSDTFGIIGFDLMKKYQICLLVGEPYDIVILILLGDGTVLGMRLPTDAEIPIIAELFKTLPLE